MKPGASLPFLLLASWSMAQAPLALPRLLQLGPLPEPAAVLELRADGSSSAGGKPLETAALDPWLATPSGEVVLAVARDVTCAAVCAVLDRAIAARLPRVHFAATLPDGARGGFVLALPEAADATTSIELRLHRQRAGVPAESCVPLLQRLRRGTDAAPIGPFVLGVVVPGDEPFEALLQALAAVARAECGKVVLRCERTRAQQQPGDFAWLARVAPAAAPRALAIDLGPAPAISVRPFELPQETPAVLAESFGCRDRAPVGKQPPTGGGVGGRYGGRAGGRARASETADSIAGAIGWIRRRQQTDGGFADEGTAPGLETNALLLLTMLGDGNTLLSGPQADLVCAGAGWLLAQQLADGRLDEANPVDLRKHALATYALVEVAGLSPNGALLRGAVQDALDLLQARRQADGGWNDGRPGAPSDMASTVCSLMAIASAQFFSFPVAVEPTEIAKWFDTVAEPTGAHRMTASAKKDDPRQATATAAALFGRFFCGQDTKEQPVMKGAADLLIATADPGDPWCCYWTTYALFQMGGRHWAAWNKRLEQAVVRTQSRSGEHKGCWEAAGGCSRLTTTALYGLSLEAYYRYSRLVR